MVSPVLCCFVSMPKITCVARENFVKEASLLSGLSGFEIQNEIFSDWKALARNKNDE